MVVMVTGMRLMTLERRKGYTMAKKRSMEITMSVIIEAAIERPMVK